MTTADRREYLRQKKAESRARAQKLVRSRTARQDGRAAEVTTQLSLTVSTGAKAILSALSAEQGASMSAIIESLIISHPRAAAVRRSLPGLFPQG
jgi:hypothetical protein